MRQSGTDTIQVVLGATLGSKEGTYALLVTGICSSSTEGQGAAGGILPGYRCGTTAIFSVISRVSTKVFVELVYVLVAADIAITGLPTLGQGPSSEPHGRGVLGIAVLLHIATKLPVKHSVLCFLIL